MRLRAASFFKGVAMSEAVEFFERTRKNGHYAGKDIVLIHSASALIEQNKRIIELLEELNDKLDNQKHKKPTVCKACLFFDFFVDYPLSGERGHCKRNAPTTSGGEFRVAEWPQTNAESFCFDGEEVK